MRASDRKDYLKIAVLFVAILIFGATHVAAQPKTGETVSLTGTILCDEAEQLNAIMDAQKETWEAGLLMYQFYERLVNADDDPTCYSINKPANMTVVLGKVMSTHEGVYKDDGTRTTVYVIAVLWPFADNDWRPGVIIASFNPEKGEELPA